MPRGFAVGLERARNVYRSSRSSSGSGSRRPLLILGAGVAAYVAALLVTLPARFVLASGPERVVTGTIWNGTAAFDGGWLIEWRWSPARSLAALAFAADIRIVGAGTELTGAMAAWPGGRRFDDLSGRADAAMLGGAGLRCEGSIDVARASVLLAGVASSAAGDARTNALRCASSATATPADLPPLTIRAVTLAGRSRIDIAPIGRARLTVIDGSISAGRLQLAPTPAGIALAPALRGFAIDEAL